MPKTVQIVRQCESDKSTGNQWWSSYRPWKNYEGIYSKFHPEGWINNQNVTDIEPIMFIYMFISLYVFVYLLFKISFAKENHM